MDSLRSHIKVGSRRQTGALRTCHLPTILQVTARLDTGIVPPSSHVVRFELRLLDAHTHLNQYPLPELAGILERAEKAGVAGAIIAGTTLDTSQTCVQLAQNDPRLLAGVGIHPMDVREPIGRATYNGLASLAEDPNVVAISEVGLDAIEGAPNFDVQDQVFRVQINMARELALPLIYHSRGTYPHILDVLSQEKATEVGGVAHYFHGDMETARHCIDLGFLISFARTLLRLPDLQEIARVIPLEHIILETDAYPQPFKKRRENWTEPRHMLDIAQTIAALKSISLEKVVDQTTNNLLRVLGTRGDKVRPLLTQAFPHATSSVV